MSLEREGETVCVHTRVPLSIKSFEKILRTYISLKSWSKDFQISVNFHKTNFLKLQTVNLKRDPCLVSRQKRCMIDTLGFIQELKILGVNRTYFLPLLLWTKRSNTDSKSLVYINIKELNEFYTRNDKWRHTQKKSWLCIDSSS